MTAVPTLWPCTQKDRPPVLTVLGNVYWAAPASDELPEMTATDGVLLVSVTVTGAGGACPRLTELETCIMFPDVIRVAALIGGAVTVATMVRLEAGVGVENPVGVPTVRFEVPGPAGWNDVVPLVAPPANTIGLVVMVPTVVVALVNGTLTGAACGLT